MYVYLIIQKSLLFQTKEYFIHFCIFFFLSILYFKHNFVPLSVNLKEKLYAKIS